MFVSRRGNPHVIISCVAAFLLCLYGYYRYSQVSSFLDKRNKELYISGQHEKTLKDQLKVVYHHSTKLEDALKKEREDHKVTQEELQGRVREFQVNLTKSKHEAMNRFNALDTDYKMLKALNEETNQNYLSLQQNYVRLSEDHKKLASESKQDYDKLKDAKDSESKSLQNRVQDLYNEKVYIQEQLQQYQKNYKESVLKAKEARSLAKEYQDAIIVYSKQSKKANRLLRKCLLDSRGNTSNTQDQIPEHKKLFEEERADRLEAIEKFTKNKFLVKLATNLTDGGEDSSNLPRSELNAEDLTAGLDNHLGLIENGPMRRVLKGDISNRRDTVMKKTSLNEELALEITDPTNSKPLVGDDNEDEIRNDRYKNAVADEEIEPITDDENLKSEFKDNVKLNTDLILKPIRKVIDKKDAGGGLEENYNLTNRTSNNIKTFKHKKGHQFRPMNGPNDNQMPIPKKTVNPVLPPNRQVSKPVLQPNNEIYSEEGEEIEHEKEERLDVKKVTLEDDENGDQNLDHDVTLHENEAIDKLTGEEDTKK